ncbi:Magnesium and cobalt efflux protein corC [Angomonas deanei]|nr:Magnesium and cobalt efflux protein corC [Angomonas deanei]|eukprot:EPY38803.1 Magnesium and cobalt efflux protein corC [Angomonas deanei]
MTYEDMSSTQLTYYVIAIVFLIFASGATAGLQIALFSIDRLLLRVHSTTGDAVDKTNAKKLLGVLDKGHWTLVALILLNASCMMTLPVVLAHVVDELWALIISITAVLFLGEVIPLTLFVRYAIPICSFLVPVIWCAIWLTSPISYPVGKWLDHLLGHHEEMLDREELAAVIIPPPLSEESDEENNDSYCQLEDWEIEMLRGAMSLTTDTIAQHLKTTVDNCFMLSSLTPLDKTVIQSILESGYSRIPVYLANTPTQIIGVLIANSLVRMCFQRPDPPPLVGEYPLHGVLRLSETATLHSAYLAFTRSFYNMAVVYDDYGVLRGFITLSEVLYTMYRFDVSHGVVRIPLTNLPRRQHKIINFTEDMKNKKQKKQIVQPLAVVPPQSDLQVDEGTPALASSLATFPHGLKTLEMSLSRV